MRNNTIEILLHLGNEGQCRSGKTCFATRSDPGALIGGHTPGLPSSILILGLET